MSSVCRQGRMSSLVMEMMPDYSTRHRAEEEKLRKDVIFLKCAFGKTLILLWLILRAVL
jgi:hypothetical protein